MGHCFLGPGLPDRRRSGRSLAESNLAGPDAGFIVVVILPAGSKLGGQPLCLAADSCGVLLRARCAVTAAGASALCRPGEPPGHNDGASCDEPTIPSREQACTHERTHTHGEKVQAINEKRNDHTLLAGPRRGAGAAIRIGTAKNASRSGRAAKRRYGRHPCPPWRFPTTRSPCRGPSRDGGSRLVAVQRPRRVLFPAS